MMTQPDMTRFNLAAHVLAKATKQPDKVAMAVLGPSRAERWSFGRLEAAVRGVGAGLLSTGAEPGDRVLLRLGNTPEFPIAFLGAIAAGLVPVPTSAQLTTPEISKTADLVSPRLVIAAEGLAVPAESYPTINGKKLRDYFDLPPVPYVLGEAERLAYIVFTSGTSGHPHAVMHAHRSILGRAKMYEGWYGLRQTDRLMHAGAFNWTYTLGTGLLDPWTVGATALIPAAGTEPSALPLLMKRHDATLFAAAPGTYRQLLRSTLPPLPKLRHGLSAGEKLPMSLRDRWRDQTGTDIHEAFGMSECSTFISGSPARPAPDGSIGYPQPERRVALIGDDGLETDHGSIAIHRSEPGLMLGYLDDPEATQARYHGDWFLTGDIATRAADGALIYEGRSDDMMNAGGFRVSPIEVEHTLSAHPNILEAAAAQVSAGPETTLMVLFYTGPNALEADELRAFASARLARYKVPHTFIHIDALPRGANNKLLRRKLAEAWEAEHGQA